MCSASRDSLRRRHPMTARQLRAWQLSEQKYKNLLSQKDRELQLAAVKEQGLEEKLEDGGLVEAKLSCSIAPLHLVKDSSEAGIEKLPTRRCPPGSSKS